MRRCLTLVVGVLIGQWLAFGGQPSPGGIFTAGRAAWERQDYAQALRLWSHAAATNPGDAILHFWRAAALTRLGHRHEAADAYRLALLLDPPADVAALARQELSRLEAPGPGNRAMVAVVRLHPARGVWLAPVVLNETRRARFLVDTGSSVTLIAPAVAEAAGIEPHEPRETLDLQTVGGLTTGVVATLASLRVGEAVVHDVPVVIHDPGPGVDGILGNTFLARWRLTLDADRRLLRLDAAGR